MSSSPRVSGQRVTLTSVDNGGEFPPIASSLSLPVDLTAAVSPGSELILYATAPGAFVDMAADLSYALGADGSGVRLDEHLVPVSARSGLTGVEELSIVNRAEGLLLGRGHSLSEAHQHLERKAEQSGLEVYQVAAYLICMTE